MSHIRINSIEIENYRSFGERQIFKFPDISHKNPVAIVGYNNSLDDFTISPEPITLESYNQYIKSIEPNLNRILFSKKVILVEGPNDYMVYNYAIQKKILDEIQSITDIEDKNKYAETYLNFKNISIIPHHGKATVHIFINLCKHLRLDFFIINDFDLSDDIISELTKYKTLEDFQASQLYIDASSTEKGTLTTNFKIISNTTIDKLHFNIPKLEGVIRYSSDDKNSLKIWEHLKNMSSFPEILFPDKLKSFLEINEIHIILKDEHIRRRKNIVEKISIEDIPF